MCMPALMAPPRVLGLPNWPPAPPSTIRRALQASKQLCRCAINVECSLCAVSPYAHAALEHSVRSSYLWLLSQRSRRTHRLQSLSHSDHRWERAFGWLLHRRIHVYGTFEHLPGMVRRVWIHFDRGRWHLQEAKLLNLLFYASVFFV